VRVAVETASGRESFDADVVLVAVGMRPFTRDLGLEAVGVAIDERGFVRTDEMGQTNVPGIYAVGDVSGAPLLAHKATHEGEVVAEVIAGHRAAKDWVTIPSVIFTSPEIAFAGLTEAQARAKGIEVRIGKMPFTASGRAIAGNETEGFVKIVADAASERVLGVHILGPSASDARRSDDDRGATCAETRGRHPESLSRAPEARFQSGAASPQVCFDSALHDRVARLRGVRLRVVDGVVDAA
jgi:dihydrolipoamide dehydrogenase